jgi:hypothetical protein
VRERERARVVQSALRERISRKYPQTSFYSLAQFLSLALSAGGKELFRQYSKVIGAVRKDVKPCSVLSLKFTHNNNSLFYYQSRRAFVPQTEAYVKEYGERIYTHRASALRKRVQRKITWGFFPKKHIKFFAADKRGCRKNPHRSPRKITG